MKIVSIANKLKKLGVEPKITVEARHSHFSGNFTGYNVKLVASDGKNDVVATAYVDLNEFTNEEQTADQIATTSNYAVKRSNDESDSMTDYCAYTFFETINSLERIFA